MSLPTVRAARYLAMNGKRRLVGSFWPGSQRRAGFIELGQKSTGFLDTGTELRNPNFAAMAALAHDGPVLNGRATDLIALSRSNLLR